MFSTVVLDIQQAVGLHIFSLTSVAHMAIRSIIIYCFGVTLARFNKKLLGIRTPFNFLLFVMLGSLASNAIVDGQLFIPIFGVMLLLTLLNGIMTMLSFYIPSIEHFVKGTPSIIVKNGAIQWKEMKANFITKRELLNELHSQLHTQNLGEIDTATLASDGTINFITKKTIKDCS